jgi:hypothetical protein
VNPLARPGFGDSLAEPDGVIAAVIFVVLLVLVAFLFRKR